MIWTELRKIWKSCLEDRENLRNKIKNITLSGFIISFLFTITIISSLRDCNFLFCFFYNIFTPSAFPLPLLLYPSGCSIIKSRFFGTKIFIIMTFVKFSLILKAGLHLSVESCVRQAFGIYLFFCSHFYEYVIAM